jgi:hypothetical protein
VEDVDLPGLAEVGLPVPVLVDQRLLAQVVEHCRGVGGRYVVFELGSGEPPPGTLDGQLRRVALDPHADDALWLHAEVALPEADAAALRLPPARVDEVLALDFAAHEVLRVVMEGGRRRAACRGTATGPVSPASPSP